MKKPEAVGKSHNPVDPVNLVKVNWFLFYDVIRQA